eukprot:scaffold207246_cov46-Prasinocladus_malaysianus.AAC.1
MAYHLGCSVPDRLFHAAHLLGESPGFQALVNSTKLMLAGMDWVLANGNPELYPSEAKAFKVCAKVVHILVFWVIGMVRGLSCHARAQAAADGFRKFVGGGPSGESSNCLASLISSATNKGIISTTSKEALFVQILQEV